MLIFFLLIRVVIFDWDNIVWRKNGVVCWFLFIVKVWVIVYKDEFVCVVCLILVLFIFEGFLNLFV